MKAVFGRRVADGFTYKDYLEWDEENRWELIDGFPFMMGSPTRTHQRLLGQLFLQLSLFLENKQCEPYMAPFQVRLFPKEDMTDKDVVQPDLMVICDQNKIFEEGVKGAPDFVIEIVSKWSRTRDLVEKRRLYEEAGVREYWAIDLDRKKFYKYLLKDGSFEEMIKDLKENFSERVEILSEFELKF